MAAKVKIRWQADPQLSGLQAAYIVATGAACADHKTEVALLQPITEINSRLVSASLDIGKFWQQLLAEYVFDSSQSKACEIALTIAGCSELQLEQTARVVENRLSECRIAFQKRFPKLEQQLDLRGRPIRDQWETFGPGLLSQIAKMIWIESPPADWWPARVDGLLVQPMRGGDGGFDGEASKFWIEALLTDADPAVPEVLRVAWLLTQLAVQTHTRERSSEIAESLPWEIASVPLVLRAGRELEIIKTDTLPIATAMQLWNLGSDREVKIVQQWWRERQSSSAAMPVDLKRLQGMLQPARTQDAAAENEPDAGIDLSQFDSGF